MQTSRIAIALIFGAMIIITACENALVNTDDVVDEKVTVQSDDLDVLGSFQATTSKASLGGSIWADAHLFGTIGTPAHFEPEHGPFDELYNTGGNGTFKDSVAAISESKPGDQDFNGGRWHVNLLKESVDPSKYADAASVEDLDLNDFVPTDTYFECPLLARN